VATRTADYEDGLRDLRDPDLVIVGLDGDPTVGLTVIEEVHRAAPSTQVLALAPDEDPELMIKAMRAGADEFLALPLSQHALLKVCIKVSELRRSDANGGRGGALWVAYSPKGGVGVTTLIVNLAHALRAEGREVALDDLDVYAGDVALFLNLSPSYTLRDVLVNVKRLDSVFLQGSMIRHPSGIQVLASPALAPGESPLFLARDHMLAILELLSGLYEVTLVDTPGVPTEAVRAALGAADRIFLATELSVPALRGCQRTIAWLREEHVDPATHIEVIVNKYANRASEVSQAEAERTLGLPVRMVLPRDDAAATAANSGMPLADVRGGAPLARAIAGLIGRTASTPPPTSRRKSFLRLFSGAERRV
jgi:pilus assembly protein CpaE